MTELTLYNSLTRTKEVFTPKDPKRVTMYNCGPTVYSYAHIGNARAAVVADVLYRVLRHIYGEEHVIYARNITDVDDKIIAAAKELDVPISEITEKYAKIYQDDLRALNCLDPDEQPKCTEHIPQMIDMIQGLIEKGHAYVSDGHVFFDVSSYEDYGNLSGNTLENLRGGDRVGEGEVARKKNAADFVLWKPPLDGVGWDAPFGEGRPGWHIECSAMAKAVLCDADYGNVIDIHCGGVDLKFPHHENEIAQSCCGNDTDKFANYWVHNEFLNMGSEKMSKSLGNVTLIHDLLKDWDGEVIRLALLKAHYRSELVWTEDLLKESKAQLDGLYRIMEKPNDGEKNLLKEKHFDEMASIGLFDDLDTLNHIVYASLNGIVFLEDHLAEDQLKKLTGKSKKIFEVALKLKKRVPKSEAKALILHWMSLIGLLQKDPEEWFKGGLDTDKYDQLVKDYDAARADAIAAKKSGDKAKMGELFKKSDAIRDELQSEGIAIETGPDGSSWRKA